MINSKKMEQRFLDFVQTKIAEGCNPIWSLVGSFRAYLYNYHPECLDEFFYRITDDEAPKEILYDISQRFDLEDKQLNLIIDAIPEMELKRY